MLLDRTRFSGLRRTVASLALLYAVAASSLAAEPGKNDPASELPMVIPYPQQMRRIGNDRIVLGEGGAAVAKIVAVDRAGLCGEAAKLIESTLREGGLRSGTRPEATTILLVVAPATVPSGTNAPGIVAPQGLNEWTPEDTAVLARSEQAYVIHMSSGPPAKVWIVGASPLGVYYGAATLVQLANSATPGSLALPHVEIRDYPDTPGRMSADWVLAWDWEINGYDWGDGLDAFLSRCKRKIDLCARYKVNRVRFLGGRISPGPAYMKDRYPLIRKFALELNQYARRKGVALQYSSSNCGIDYIAWGRDCPEPWILNRESYPDGPVYPCVGGTDWKPTTAGGCLSNDALIELIARRQKQLVQDIEPGSIYLHNMDLAGYRDMATAWKSRCPRCRQRFPDNEPYSARGYAAAVANLYNRIITELKSVRNPESGYDASRDLEIVFASPGYSVADESDADWGKDLKYFAEIARQGTDRRHVQMTFREQFQRLDKGGLRIEEMARTLEQAGWPDAMFVFAVQGADFLDSANLLVSTPVVTGTYRGAATMYNFNGHVFSEIQALANVNYAWNHDAPGSLDPGQFAGALLREEVSRYSKGRQHSEFLYGRFLDYACAELYGRNAAPSMAEVFRLDRDKGPVVPLVAWIDRNARTQTEYGGKDPRYDWRAQAERNRLARQLVDRAAAACDTGAKPDLVWMSRCLEVSAKICMLCDAVRREKPGRAEIAKRADELLKWLYANFQFQVTEPDGGDPGLWKKVVAAIRAGTW
jgi:hypothetical protein